LLDARKSLAALAIVGALGFAGCGGDDDESTTSSAAADTENSASGSATLPADFAEEADQICADGYKEIEANAEPFKGKPSDQDIASFVNDAFIPSVQGQIDDIRELGSPSEGADELAQFLDDAQAALDDLKSDPSLLESDRFAEVEQEAGALGLEECAS
jgi:hypothetical protein